MRHNEIAFLSLSGRSLKKKSGLEFFSFFFIFVVFIDSLAASPASQKLADMPIDKAIRVKVHNGGEYCYAPAFVDGESYVYIDDCASPNVQFARYDVFQRVAWKVKNVWLCMAAPGSVTGIDEKATANWGYITLRPCVINDANQRWVIKNNAFYTADEKFRVKDYKWYAYISNNEEDYYDHTLSPAMEKWINTIATPGNMSFKTSLGWKFKSDIGFSMYYISDDGSKSEVFNLYYNPENGHIARYFPSSGLLSCMTSRQSSHEDWDWAKWSFCNDNIPATKDSGYWDISLLAGREGPILDRGGNLLRVTQYGSNWGTPYTMRPDYIEKDTTNSPTSEFVLDYDIERWNRYVTANLEDALPYCPAPGNKQNISESKRRVKRSLPPNFQFNEAWRKRLYAIATSTSDVTASVGICGTCLLQTYQMIAELQENFSGPPRSSGGYFFDTAPSTDPMISLRERFASIHNVMQNAPQFYGVPLSPTETSDMIAARIASSTTQSVLPRFSWMLSNLATDRSAILDSIRRLLDAPPGTIWIGLVSYTLQGGGTARHALPILRSSNGLKVIPTNTIMSFFQFTNEVSETTDANLVMLRLAQRTNVTINSFATLRLGPEEEQPLSITLSQSNCTGEGEDRRGSGQLPRSALVNQCASGRCSF
ncbi:hypothetical protein BAnh1_04110 [Bartonella australis AUST/NH1]|uniref:PF07598 family protein n=1 Tax=Bartonella australis (strain Aust/NH1) TaxID=1094489 RepID=M1NXT9_BARAA|nr:DUF1561 family protein [Bartonella australis]AGF74292.1 hypothetical protein BAnh1_04110 [Bartonella australis AUST/NH1]